MASNTTTSEPVEDGDQDHWSGSQALCSEVQQLDHLFKEWAHDHQHQEWKCQFCQELNETKEELVYEDSWAEDLDTDEWEGTWYSVDCEEDEDFENLTTADMSTQTAGHQETELDGPYEEPQKARLTGQQRFGLELQAERSKNKALLDELKGLRASNNERNKRYEADIITIRKQTTKHKAELENLVNSLMKDFLAEQAAVHQRVIEEMGRLQKNAAEEKTRLQSKVEELSTELAAQLTLNKESVEVRLQEEQEGEKEEAKGEPAEVPGENSESFLEAFEASEGTEPSEASEASEATATVEASVATEAPARKKKKSSLWKTVTQSVGPKRKRK